MKKESGFFEENGIKIHYTKSGKGNKNLIVFHGFGQTEQIYDQLRTSFNEEYTVYCFDLFFHGQSDWLLVDLFTSSDWIQFFTSFLIQKEIEYFSLLTFSIGTRFGLVIYEHMPSKIEKIWLIAPEGLTIHWIYKLITGVAFTRFLFRYTIAHPQYFLNFILLLVKLKLVPKRGYRFLTVLMKTREQRLQVYKTWIVLRKLTYNTAQIISNINQYHPKLFVFVSKKDYIVPYFFVKRFLKKIEKYKLKKYHVSHFHLLHKVTKYFQR